MAGQALKLIIHTCMSGLKSDMVPISHATDLP